MENSTLERVNIAQNILENSNTLLQLSTAIIVCDQKFQIMLINPSAQELLDTSDSYTLGASIFKYLRHPDNIRLLTQCLASNQSTVVRQTKFLDSKHREKIVDCIITPILLQHFHFLILEINAVETVVSTSQQNTMEASQNANAAVVRMIAHEIKNPLGGVRGAAQLLDRELNLHPELREYTKIIVKETDRLCALVDNLVGPQKPLHLSEVNIHEVLEHVRVLALAEGLYEDQIDRDYDPSLPSIRGDREQLIQVFVNIVRNAIEATDQQGQLLFRTRVGRHVNIGRKLYRRVAKIDIEDNGPGIPEEILNQVFCPMISGKAHGEGLGLSISHKIIARHNGLVSCQSKPGETRFTIYLKFFDDGN